MKSLWLLRLLCCLTVGTLVAAPRPEGRPYLTPINGYLVEDVPVSTYFTPPEEPKPVPAFDPKATPEDTASDTSVADSDGWQPLGRDPPSGPYRLNIGDRMLISIYGEDNTQREVVVDSAGEIVYPIVGTLFAMGKTIDEVREEMNKKIGTFFRHTFINITPIEFGGQTYTILGQVLQPGSKVIYGKETVLSAIARAGGFVVGFQRANTVDLVDLDRAFLMRRGQYVPVDFARLVYEGDLSQNVELQGGDYIFIPNILHKQIFVLGEVLGPSTFNYLQRVTLVEAITQAGGLGPNASSRVWVIRGSLCEPYSFNIDITRILRGCAPDFCLQPGDIVYVPPQRFAYLKQIAQFAVQIFVSNFFSQAGIFAFEEAFNTTANIQNVNLIPTGITTPPVIITPGP